MTYHSWLLYLIVTYYLLAAVFTWRAGDGIRESFKTTTAMLLTWIWITVISPVVLIFAILVFISSSLLDGLNK